MEEQNYQQNKKKRTLLSILGIAILVIGLVGVTYAFFNYTRTGANNTIQVGRIYFNSEEGQAINLSNMFPIDTTEQGIMNDATKVGTLTINIKGDTEYNGGIEYLVSAVNVTNTVGTGQSAKRVPISIAVSVESNDSNDPATTLGNADVDYYTDRGPSAQTSIYKVLASDTIDSDGDILVGYIKEGSTGVDGNIVIKAYIDKTKVAITDTYPEATVYTVKTTLGEADITACTTALTGVTGVAGICDTSAHLQAAIDAGNVLSAAQITLLENAGLVTEYTNGTTSTWVGDREVFTTAEWNALQQSGISFKIKVVANEGTWVENPVLCKRVVNAVDLHTETCNQLSNKCYADGYTGDNKTITYGNAKAKGQVLAVGDAFDCNVDGTGYNQRFYYVSDYFDTATKQFDNTTAALIYFENYYNGEPSLNGSAIYATDDSRQGPLVAVTHLPTTNSWSNISLKNTTRAILGENGSNHNLELTSYTSEEFNKTFSYVGYAARLITAQEIMRGCELSTVGSNTSGELSTKCKFLFENTEYSGTQYINNESISHNSIGSWLETPHGGGWDAFYLSSNNRRTASISNTNPSIGVRPAIDVPYSKLEY